MSAMTTPFGAMTQDTQKLLDVIKQQLSVEKAYTTSLGLNWYDLEPYAKLLYPVITPLRNEIPRVPANGGTATNWKAITAINTTNVDGGVSEGNRNAVMSVTEVDYTAPYRGLGMEDYETWEQEYSSQNFDNIRALMGQNLLYATMLKEEFAIIGGNGSDGIPLGTPANPVLTPSASGGSLATQTLSVIVVALTLDGYQRATVSATGVIQTYTRNNADGSSDTMNGGSSQKSANVTASITGPNGSCVATVTAIAGAVAYAWYWNAAGSEKLGAITTVNTVTITAAAAGGNQAATAITADCSKNSLVFSGIISQTLKSGSNGYFKSLDGSGLTPDNAGGIVELETALQYFWNTWRTSPTRMLVNSQELLNISKKVVVGSGTAPLFRFIIEQPAGSVGALTFTAGSVVGSYLNKYTMNGGSRVDVMLHPNVPPGTIIFYSNVPPYPIARVKNVIQMKVRKEYYQIDWALRSRKYEAGVYCDELLQIYFTGVFGVLSNIANA